MLHLVKMAGYEVLATTKIINTVIGMVSIEWMGYTTENNWQCGKAPVGETLVLEKDVN